MLIQDIVTSWRLRGFNKPSFAQNSDFDLQPSATPAQVLRSCLIDFGLVFYPGILEATAGEAGVNRGGYPCFVGSMPDEEDQAVRLRDSAGKIFGSRARDGVNTVYPGVTILVRSPDYTQGYLKTKAIADAIDKRFPLSTRLPEDGSPWFLQKVQRQTDVMTLGEEKGKQRELFSLNVYMIFE